jgi:hypothetical protein
LKQRLGARLLRLPSLSDAAEPVGEDPAAAAAMLNRGLIVDGERQGLPGGRSSSGTRCTGWA